MTRAPSGRTGLSRVRSVSSPKWNQERGRYADKMRKRGTPLLVTPTEFQAAASLLAKARGYGMSDAMIGRQVGVPNSLPSKVRRGVIKTMHRDSFERVMKLRPEKPAVFFAGGRGKVGGGPYCDATGTVRRVQALRADGFPGHLLGEHLGVSYEAVAQLARMKRGRVLKTTRTDMAKLYGELAGKRPEDFGIPSNVVGKCSTWARRAGYVPRSCWDPDTIDDPSAIPQWTGQCGTWWGWHIHERDGIPVCPACEPHRGDEPYPGFDGLLLRKLRERKGFSRVRLASVVGGLNPTTIQYWETGRSKPLRQNKIDLVLSALDATFDEVCHPEEAEDGRSHE